MTVKVTIEQKTMILSLASLCWSCSLAHSCLRLSYIYIEEGEVDDPRPKVAQPPSDASFLNIQIFLLKIAITSPNSEKHSLLLWISQSHKILQFWKRGCKFTLLYFVFTMLLTSKYIKMLLKYLFFITYNSSLDR